MYFDLQKASLLKRISAFILDAIILLVLVTGFGFVVSSIIKYDDQFDKMTSLQEVYATEYGINTSLTEEEYEALLPEQKAMYDEGIQKMNSDEELKNQYLLVMNMTLTILSLACLLSYLVSEFICPLILGNGQTIGKKIFGICLMQTNHIKVSNISLAVRTFLGKFALETMIPLLIVIMILFGFTGFNGTIAIGLLLLIELCLISFTPNSSSIHDLLSSTVVVDMKSQWIFENKEALMECEKKTQESKKMDGKRDL